MFDTNNELDAGTREINMFGISHCDFRTVFTLSPLYAATMNRFRSTIFVSQKKIHDGKHLRIQFYFDLDTTASNRDSWYTLVKRSQ